MKIMNKKLIVYFSYTNHTKNIANEIKDYIVSRLSAAGCNEPLFADDCFDLLYSMTNGHPREINSICRMCLISAASKENKFITKEDIFNAHKEVSIISN